MLIFAISASRWPISKFWRVLKIALKTLGSVVGPVVSHLRDKKQICERKQYVFKYWY